MTDESIPYPPKSSRTPWLILGAVVMMVGGCWMVASSSQQKYMGAVCQNNLKQIALALMMYETVNKSFPPPYFADADGKPIHSWRVMLLPYLEQQSLYIKYRFDEPWDGPNNRKLHDEIVYQFACPFTERNGKLSSQTSYLAVVGEGTAWPPGKSVKMSQIHDGASNTVAVVEVENSDIHWMEPRDLELERMQLEVNPKKGWGPSSRHAPAGAYAAMFDGSIWKLDSQWSPEELRALFTRSGKEKHRLPSP